MNFTYVIPDIHGRYDLLCSALGEITAYARGEATRLWKRHGHLGALHAAFRLVPGRSAAAVPRAGAVSTLHGVVFAILCPDPAVHRHGGS